MRVRVLGGGIYGCHLSAALLADGHEVELHEKSSRLFSGASGNCPARLHLGFHYPRSRATRWACQQHAAAFRQTYGAFVRSIPTNIYAIAKTESLLDFGTYTKVLEGEVKFAIADPLTCGLTNVEGAVLTGEQHLNSDGLRDHFAKALDGHVIYAGPDRPIDDPRWDATIDCTFCANDGQNVDRYEPCLTVLLEGPVDRSVTIMDGPFSGIYVWNEEQSLSSLTSARFTPFSKTCRTYGEARAVLEGLSSLDLRDRGDAMMAQIATYWPAAPDLYRIVDYRTAIRAMPASGSDARLVDVITVGDRGIRVRAGKIDAIFDAEKTVKEMLACR